MVETLRVLPYGQILPIVLRLFMEILENQQQQLGLLV